MEIAQYISQVPTSEALQLVARSIVRVFGLWLIGVSVLMVFAPQRALLLLSKAASTNFINYSEITLRLIAGLGMVFYSPYLSAGVAANIIFVLGGFIIVSSLVLFIVPRRWHAAYAVWWSRKLSPFLVRVFAPPSLAAGTWLFLTVS